MVVDHVYGRPSEPTTTTSHVRRRRSFGGEALPLGRGASALGRASLGSARSGGAAMMMGGAMGGGAIGLGGLGGAGGNGDWGVDASGRALLTPLVPLGASGSEVRWPARWLSASVELAALPAATRVAFLVKVGPFH